MPHKKSANEFFIFSWSKDRLGWLYLTAFTMFSVMIHGAGFYLFQVVYPAPTRVDPTMQSVSILDESNPEVRSQFQRLKDRTVYLTAPSEQSDVRVRLQDHEVRFLPSFQSIKVEPIPPDYPWSLSLREAKVIALPETNKKGESLASFDDSLGECRVAPWSLFEDYLERAEAVPAFRVRLRVLPDGDVRVIKIEAELEEENRRKLIEVIESTLRFLPSEIASEGWMDVWARG